MVLQLTLPELLLVETNDLARLQGSLRPGDRLDACWSLDGELVRELRQLGVSGVASNDGSPAVGGAVLERHCRAVVAGESRWMSLRACAGDEPGMALVVVEDCTTAQLERADLRGKLTGLHRSTAVIEFSMEGTVLTANENFLSMTGYRLDQVVGRHHRIFCEPAYVASDEYVQFWRRLRAGEFEEGEYLRLGADGREIWIQATYNPIFDEDGRLVKVVKFASDITAAKARNVDCESRVRAIDRAQSVIEYDLDGVVVDVNENFLALTGYTADEVVGRHHRMFCDSVEVQSPAYASFWDELRAGRFVSGRFRRFGKRGEIWIRATYSPIFDLHGRPRGVVKFAYDVTADVHLEQRSIRQARTDPLTGLCNRTGGHAALGAALNSVVGVADRRVAAVFLDLDGFKRVNDQYGHRVGDEVLLRAAERLETAAPSAATVSRLGGDEFLVVLPLVRDEDEAMGVAEHLLAELHGPVLVEGNVVNLAGSAGVAVSRASSFMTSDLLREADTAVYHAKHAGRGRARLFDAELQAATEHQRRLANDLAIALEHRAIDVHYQPIVNLERGTLEGFEALARWDRPGFGPVSPSEFVQVAEECGLVAKLDRLVLDRALEQSVRWSVQWGITPSMAINVSARHLADPQLYRQVMEALHSYGLDPRRLVLEITETAVLHDTSGAASVLAQLRETGVRVALDDFGTGFTSIGQLWTLPVDIVKIDRSFVQRLDSDRVRTVVRLMVDAAHALGLEVISEGVETIEHLEAVRSLGCDTVQGYLVCPPRAPGDLDLPALTAYRLPEA